MDAMVRLRPGRLCVFDGFTLAYSGMCIRRVMSVAVLDAEIKAMTRRLFLVQFLVGNPKFEKSWGTLTCLGLDLCQKQI